jgi:hypothetical protein
MAAANSAALQFQNAELDGPAARGDFNPSPPGQRGGTQVGR